MQNSILTNMTSIAIRRNMYNSQYNISSSLERMASGVRLNQAKDGAAEYAISSKMGNRISGLNGSIDNISHGQNMLLQMDKTLENMLEKVNKIQTLALEASNSTYGIEERIAIQNEIDQLRAEVYREKEIAAYGDKKIFEPTEIKEVLPYAYEVEYLESKGNQYIDTGYVLQSANLAIDMNIETGTIPNSEAGIIGNYKGGSATNAFVIGFWQGQAFLYSKSDKADTNVLNTNVAPNTKMHIQANYDSDNNTKSMEINGIKKENNAYTVDDFSDEPITIFKGNATLAKASMKLYDCKIYDDGILVKDYIPVVDHNGRTALYDKVNEELVYDENGKDFIAGNVVVPPPPTMSITTLQVGADAGVENSITLALNVTFGILTGSVMNEADSKTLSDSAKSYMDKILESRSQIGSALNRLESAHSLQSNDMLNLSSSKSTIADTDMASESTKLAHNQILQQISTSLFSQSHNITGNLALRLLGVA